jgi:hypothetical protein
MASWRHGSGMAKRSNGSNGGGEKRRGWQSAMAWRHGIQHQRQLKVARGVNGVAASK